MEKQTMKEIPVNDRPYERCIRQGPEALSDEELLSVIIRTGSQEGQFLRDRQADSEIELSPGWYPGTMPLNTSGIKRGGGDR